MLGRIALITGASRLRGIGAAIIPMGRLGLPDDAARTVVFLASDDTAWVTGQVLRADGGFSGRFGASDR